MNMRNVNHTDPNSTENTFGRLFRRGPELTDGGESAADEESGSEPTAAMQDIDHEHGDTPDPNEVWERGGEAEE
ncbi:hypothetical protein [Halocalculus aciditolerans]|uniref:Uncharacterized protein n=1 Tax=Halocalculus aciditolerans TaxID=1383812 RepID=A0A830F1F3_9EURY|nr:hypothetical protein [Halocalculus aciditolerans]GGL52085.1 hypothetical protein GCM10009039_07980 [Halocalculus aciditolerans]